MFEARCDELELFGSGPDVAAQHFSVALEAAAGEHHLFAQHLTQAAVVLADLDSTHLAIVTLQQFDGLRFPQDVETLVCSEVREQSVDDGVASAIREHEMLVRVEFEEDVLFVMVVELDAMVEEVLRRDWNLFLHLKTIVLICKPI